MQGTFAFEKNKPYKPSVHRLQKYCIVFELSSCTYQYVRRQKYCAVLRSIIYKDYQALSGISLFVEEYMHYFNISFYAVITRFLMTNSEVKSHAIHWQFVFNFLGLQKDFEYLFLFCRFRNLLLMSIVSLNPKAWTLVLPKFRCLTGRSTLQLNW